MTGPTPSPNRWLALGGLLLWLLAALALVWEVLALQTPDSPYHLGVLAGPIQQLHHGCFALGTGLLAGALLQPFAFGQDAGKYWPMLCLAGAVLHTGVLVYCAVTGVVGVQLLDPRPGSLPLVVLRGSAHLLLIAALADLTLRLWRRPPAR